MKHILDSDTPSKKDTDKKNDTKRVLARQVSRQLTKTELDKVSGAGRECDWTDNGGMFPALDCTG